MAAPTDPLYAQQWYLTGPWGIHLGNVWDDYTGSGVVVGLHDQGIDFTHPDLNDNIDTTHSFNAATGGAGGAPVTSDDDHGTATAGIIAGERNGVGIVGVAYGSTLISYYDPLQFSSLPTGAANARNHAATEADVLSNSWGYGNAFYDDANSAFIDNFASPTFAAAAAATRNAAEHGRDGLGTIIVQSAGNTRDYGDNTNLHNFSNNQWTITVGATDQDGSLADYSTPGASILVGAPGSPLTGTIVTTDRVGAAGYAAGDYTTTFNGTSAAAPMVSGVVALMLQANPHLGWRDVQEILAYSARTAPAASGDHTNGATNWNGGGLTVNHDIGFGLVDAHAAVRLAESWTGAPHTSANEVDVSATATPNVAIPDGDATGVTSTLAIASGIEIDRVEVALNISHTWIGDLEVILTSPNGTQSTLIDRPGLNPGAVDGSNQDNVVFTVGSVQDWGETGQGTWTLTVRDMISGDTGTLNSWTLHLLGDAPSPDDTYIYTDEFGTLGTAASRQTLTDTGGNDTINGAALTGACIIDLDSGACSIAGRAFSLAAGTVIENAIGGDGNDSLTGGAGANQLTGGRGDDVLHGGAGADILTGGAGSDFANYQHSTSGVSVDLLAHTASGGDAQGDVLSGIENLYGSSNADHLSGDNGRSVIGGELGDDVIVGNGGDDALSGEGGNDSLDGGDGNDRLVGGDGADTIHGGTGVDSVDAGTGNDIVFGDAGNDTLTGGAGDDQLDGGDGNDVEFGSAGADQIHGGAGIDTAYYSDSTAGVTVSLSGGAGSGGTGAGDTLDGVEQIYGSGFADHLSGNGGANTLWGAAGNDVLTGGGGADVLKGGAGNDIFVYTSVGDSTVAATGRDLIADFTTGDRIDLSAIDADGNAANGDTGFSFGTGGFTGHAGEVRIVDFHNGVQGVYLDVNADRVPESIIMVIADHVLAALDFVL